MSESMWQRETGSPSSLPSPPVELADYAAVMATPWPTLKLGVHIADEAITSIDFLPGETEDLTAMSGLAEDAVKQLQQYFRNPHHGFNLPLAPTGTLFQQRTWDAMRRIPAGATSSYGALARCLNTSARAVGGACRANPIPVIIPCHRIVAGQGMGGFMGATAGRAMQIKQYLLDHELQRND